MLYNKSHFLFNRQQRSGILLLVLLIASLQVFNYFYESSDEMILDISSSETVCLQEAIDSLRNVEIEARKPKIYPFNPNFITDFKAYTLGMSPKEFDRLQEYREANKWINSVHDFKRVTQVSDSVLNKISPYFKFPKWVTQPKPKRKYQWEVSVDKSFEEKIDLNTGTKSQLEAVSGIGDVLSSRIIDYREKLGGFSDDVQLYQVYGLKWEVVQKVFRQFTVKTPMEIIKINLNEATASDIATIPGISYELAKEIWEYRILREGVKDFTELEKIERITAIRLRLIQVYLFIK